MSDERIERTVKQTYDSTTGKDRVGQDIEDRGEGVKNIGSTCTFEGSVSRTSPNFSRATIEVPKAADIKEDDFTSQIDGVTKEELGDGDIQAAGSVADFLEAEDSQKGPAVATFPAKGGSKKKTKKK